MYKCKFFFIGISLLLAQQTACMQSQPLGDFSVLKTDVVLNSIYQLVSKYDNEVEAFKAVKNIASVNKLFRNLVLDALFAKFQNKYETKLHLALRLHFNQWIKENIHHYAQHIAKKTTVGYSLIELALIHLNEKILFDLIVNYRANLENESAEVKDLVKLVFVKDSSIDSKHALDWALNNKAHPCLIKFIINYCNDQQLPAIFAWAVKNNARNIVARIIYNELKKSVYSIRMERTSNCRATIRFWLLQNNVPTTNSDLFLGIAGLIDLDGNIFDTVSYNMNYTSKEEAYKRFKAIEMLLEAGLVDFNERDKSGHTLYEIARMVIGYYNGDIARLLAHYGAGAPTSEQTEEQPSCSLQFPCSIM
jgi:hypothetical protein